MTSVLINKAIPGAMKNANASPLFPSLCTIQYPDGLLVDAGQPSGNYVIVLANIPCTAPPMSSARIMATEVKDLEDIQAFAPRHVLLNGYYPLIVAEVSDGWQAVIDGIVFDLLGAESDSQHQMTRLGVRTSGM